MVRTAFARGREGHRLPGRSTAACRLIIFKTPAKKQAAGFKKARPTPEARKVPICPVRGKMKVGFHGEHKNPHRPACTIKRSRAPSGLALIGIEKTAPSVDCPGASLVVPKRRFPGRNRGRGCLQLVGTNIGECVSGGAPS